MLPVAPLPPFQGIHYHPITIRVNYCRVNHNMHRAADTKAESGWTAPLRRRVWCPIARGLVSGPRRSGAEPSPASAKGQQRPKARGGAVGL